MLSTPIQAGWVVRESQRKGIFMRAVYRRGHRLLSPDVYPRRQPIQNAIAALKAWRSKRNPARPKKC